MYEAVITKQRLFGNQFCIHFYCMLARNIIGTAKTINTHCMLEHWLRKLQYSIGFVGQLLFIESQWENTVSLSALKASKLMQLLVIKGMNAFILTVNMPLLLYPPYPKPQWQVGVAPINNDAQIGGLGIPFLYGHAQRAVRKFD